MRTTHENHLKHLTESNQTELDQLNSRLEESERQCEIKDGELSLEIKSKVGCDHLQDQFVKIAMSCKKV